LPFRILTLSRKSEEIVDKKNKLLNLKFEITPNLNKIRSGENFSSKIQIRSEVPPPALIRRKRE